MNLLARAVHYATMLRLDVLNLKIPRQAITLAWKSPECCDFPVSEE